jgi:membrane-associated protein
MNHLIDIFFLQSGFIDRFVTWVIEYGGLYFLLLVIFAETGLFVGFFFPGDSLLFVAGIYLDSLVKELIQLPESAKISFGFYHIVIILMVVIASFVGNLVGYWFGMKTGPLLYERRETLLFRKKHLLKAKGFYDKYGRPTIFLAKFLPIIRTFAPIVAGMVKMDKAIFVFYNIIGSLCWVASMMLGGYFLDSWAQKRFDFSLKEYIEPITIGIILITTLPVLYKLFFGKKAKAETDEIEKSA